MKTLRESCFFLTLSFFCLIYASPFSVMYSQEPDGAKKDLPVIFEYTISNAQLNGEESFSVQKHEYAEYFQHIRDRIGLYWFLSYGHDQTIKLETRNHLPIIIEFKILPSGRTDEVKIIDDAGNPPLASRIQLVIQTARLNRFPSYIKEDFIAVRFNFYFSDGTESKARAEVALKDVPVKSENLKDEEAVFSREETPKEIAEKYSKAVVLLTTLDENNEPISLGSGFVVDPIGIIVTNYHVIEDATTVWVKFPNGAHYKAEGVLGVDEEWDVAVLKLKAEGLSSVRMGDSSKLSAGERIVTIGNPKGLETTVSDGIISALRDVGDTTEKLIQFTAPVSPGSSGGPLFNTKGEVVGIATAVVPPSEEAQNLNFAVPINRAKTLLTGKKTITHGEVAKGTETEVSTIVDLIKEIIAILSDKDTGKVEEYEEHEEDEEEDDDEDEEDEEYE